MFLGQHCNSVFILERNFQKTHNQVSLKEQIHIKTHRVSLEAYTRNPKENLLEYITLMIAFADL